MKLRAVASALPSWVVDNEEIAAWSGLEPAFVAAKLGVERRAFLAEEETAAGLAAEACRRLIQRSGLEPARVELLVVVTQNPDYRLPHTSALLQRELDVPTSSACFDLNLGCSGWVYALSVAKGFMASEGLRDALVVTCDPYSRIMGRGDREVVGLFGDAAAATWLSADEGGEIGRIVCGTDGRGATRLVVRAGGSARPLGGLAAATAPEHDPRDLRLAMDGRGIFNFVLKNVPASVEACLERNGLAPDDVDYFVFHQASRYMVETLAERMGLPPDRVPLRLADVGNTVSSTVPMVLETLELPGRTVLVSGFGVGLSWATNVVRF